ncbi:MAG: hypothetical protein EVJ48_01850 [Candidatus Acidulodesulfobacterium acidiphilum]|uniref:RepB-like DNA primase domain-containing protein n=1 Tax=Candidatus Acidulodesulfobacterium acidiphilum TaxID=2597224 RepID=A0A520XGD0_9DELT|nr:MAG: hypothetical protein EVJ48_01850 [Candidatus Acidulodesulfobacterium acidiphilum]
MEKSKEILLEHFKKIFLKKDDTVAFVLLKKDNKPFQIFKKIGDIDDSFIEFLEKNNNNGYSIHGSVNPLLPNPTKRTKDFYSENQRRLWLDLDNKKNNYILLKFKQFLIDFNLPKPNQITQSSEGNYHIYWVLDKEYNFEILSKMMLRMNIFLKLDHTQDITRLLRLPGFYSKKPGKNDFVCCPFKSLNKLPVNINSFAKIDNIKIQAPNNENIKSNIMAFSDEKGELWNFKVNSKQTTRDIYNISTKRLKSKSLSEIDLSFAKILDINNVSMEIIKTLLISLATGRKPNPEYYAQKTIEKL